MSQWIDVAAQADLFEGAGISVVLGEVEIALFKLADKVYAIDNICTHGNARLCEGYVEGHSVECPFHQALFDLRDGSVQCGPATIPVKSWPIRLEGDRVYLNLGNEAGQPK